VELIDLYCDGEPKDRSLDQGASVALPYLRYSARFAAHKKGVGLEKAFRVTRSEWGVRFGYRGRRAIPSLRIICWSRVAS
jgi:hypothetical protein